MSSVQDRMREAVCAVQEWLTHTSNPGEAVVRQAIVLRVLHAAGFDIWNPAEVVPEETNGSGNRSDFLIRAGAGKFALELKGLKGTSGDLRGKPYEQVVTYAAGEGTRWAMLTNGKVWVILDRMHNPGGTFEDHEVLKLELGQEGHTFADDLAELLDAGMWRRDGFAGAVRTVADRQQRRLDEARIHREQRPEVEALQAEYGVATFEQAAQLAARLGLITEAERDVLLGVPARPLLTPPGSAKPRRQASVRPPQDPSSPGLPPHELHFTYRIAEAVAHAIYRPADGSWTVRAGSTLVPEIKAYAAGVSRHREQLLSAGKLAEADDQLKYVADVVYSTPSAAAGAISGGSKNGWDVWKDAQGRPAQHHRPDPQPG